MKNFLLSKKDLVVSAKGFTLIELLVALTIVAILAVGIYAALNPAQRLKDAKDAKRASDVDALLTAIHEYIVDNKGATPTGMPASGTTRQLGTGNATDCPAAVGTHCSGLTTTCADLSTSLANYIKSIPIDPVGGTTATAVKTGYAVEYASSGIVTVSACYTDAATPITASR